jgi:hypothetical protein
MACPDPDQQGDPPLRADRDARERDLLRELRELSRTETSDEEMKTDPSRARADVPPSERNTEGSEE